MVGANISYGAPRCLLAAWLREAIGTSVDVLRGTAEPPADGAVPICKGCRQGGSGAPSAWSRVMSEIAASLLIKWKSVPAVSWSQDIAESGLFIYARSVYISSDCAVIMQPHISDVAAAFERVGLRFGEGSLEVLVNRQVTNCPVFSA